MDHISTVLVANRGEIACRVIGTLRDQGVRAVAVYSDADADAPHVRAADAAVRLGPAPARQSYLDIDRVIDAARRTGAEAIHPGYGFLAENAAFARACAAAGIAFIGPPPEAIETMGDKISARAAVEARGVPTVPGISRPGLDDAALLAAAADIGFPVLIKPSAGGGGKGMHRVEDPAELPGALAAARREAAGAFGDDTLFLERFVDTPRHIEVQVLADAHGSVIHLGERECSLQRRHQKVVEEAPSPLLDAATRERIGAAACDAARSVGYVGAGTVEFIVPAAEPDAFYFMEMNTRLQVEHPVTEEITGVDLVAAQLAVARGEPLPLTQEQVRLDGHAVEARVYAEDPGAGFLPTGGRIRRVVAPAGPGIRVDSGIADGVEVTSLYDPMLMKIIAHGADRAEALDRLDRALAGTVVAGVGVNVDFLRHLLADPDVAAGRLDTGLLERIAGGHRRRPAPDEALIAAAMDWLLARWPAAAASPWRVPDAWRPGGAAAQRLRLGAAGAAGGAATLIGITGAPGAAEVVVGARVPGLDGAAADDADPAPPRRYAVAAHRDGELLRVDVDGLARHWRVDAAGGDVIVAGDPGAWALVHRPVVRAAAGGAGDADAVLRAPMPGTLIAAAVADGDAVAEGDPVVVVEAMKMEHTLRAPHAGVVTLLAAPGDQVAGDAALARIDPDPDPRPTPDPGPGSPESRPDAQE
ncbi:acetyl-COA carboxylase [Corynebacterium sphenisci DSM 44792]|uniref:Biotin-dependent 3-methylcrotonyl-coenzyme A carboxylase alpha1 subunit n=1 Tax=Corynebacterium sphenisci DSM 44792 TaxID=1437874 RepID=A0A1L7CW76_9CORY|nr:biotin carboxylase N-terminal domain-containing protein [Corynebacterium sphenisci]APT90135.1 acetyl-COA carboxylase [Corynebacterium sphenisci DSM 44792]